MPRTRCFLLAVLWLGIAVSPVEAGPERFVLRGPDGTSEVRFHSKAAVESFDGVTDQVRAFVDLDPDDLGAGVRFRVEVDLASLDTGIGLRNRHMRENHLHTDRYPVAVFEGRWPVADTDSTVADPPALALASTPMELEVSGTLTLHGVSRQRTVPVRVTRLDDHSLKIESSFEIVLAEHGIPRPKFLFMKLAESQAVHVRLIVRPQGES